MTINQADFLNAVGHILYSAPLRVISGAIVLTCFVVTSPTLAQSTAEHERERALRQQQQNQPSQVNGDVLAARSFEDSCNLVKNSPSLNRYAEALYSAAKTLGENSIQSVGIDTPDGVMAGWVSNKFREAFPSSNWFEYMERSQQLAKFVTACAWELRDDQLAIVFAPSNSGFWRTAYKDYERYQSEPSSVTRSIDASGNIVTSSPSKSPFIPNTPQLDGFRLHEPDSCSMCEIAPNRYVPIVGLLFVGGEKILGQLVDERVSMLKQQEAAYAKQLENQKRAQDEEAAQAVKLISDGYSYYANNFARAKKSCEDEFKRMYTDAAEQTAASAKSARTTKEQSELNEAALEIEYFNESLARSACFVKFYTEAEIILFGSYLISPDTNVFNGIRSNQITESGKSTIRENLELSHEQWLDKRVIVGLRDQMAIAVRSSKYTDLVRIYNGIIVNNLAFGCKQEEKKISCS